MASGQSQSRIQDGSNGHAAVDRSRSEIGAHGAWRADGAGAGRRSAGSVADMAPKGHVVVQRGVVELFYA